jgi:hypothetical protein
LTIKEQVRNQSYIKKVGFGEIRPSTLQNIFIKTSELLLTDPLKAGHLLYPLKPRELEVRKVMCDVLSTMKYNYMIECPVDNPLQKGHLAQPLFVDMSVYTKKGIIDIELKESPTDIGRDFPKLLSSSSVGCGCFYLFRGENIDKQLKLIIDRYKSSYKRKYRELEKQDKIYDKWFQFFLFAYKERRIFARLYQDIKSIEFDLIFESETKLK